MLEQTFVRGKRVGIFVSDAFGSGVTATKPADVTLTVDVGGATAGALTLTLTTSADITLRKNQILLFDDGGPEESLVLVTADTPLTVAGGAVAVPVDTVDGDEGDGIPSDLAAAKTAVWDQMYRVLGTEGSDYQDGVQDSIIRNITYDAAYAGPGVDYREAESKQPQISRSGRMKPRDHAWQQVRAAVLGDRELWVKHITPDENNNPTVVREGRAKIRNYQEPNPANEKVDATYDVMFVAAVSESILAEPV